MGGMALGGLSDRRAVIKALDEFDRLGRDGFLAKYGFGRARSYYLRCEGRYYDSKAAAAVAYGYQFPGRGSLTSTEFRLAHLACTRKPNISL